MVEITKDEIRELAREEIEKAGQVDIPQLAKKLFEMQKERTNREGEHQQK